MESKEMMVVKSNRLIEASYRLTLGEQRIILYAIVEARRTGYGLSTDSFISIHATDYAKMFDIPLPKAYGQIKDAVKALFHRYVVLYDIHPETGKPRKTDVRWIADASYIDGAGIIQISFAPKIVPYITRLEAQFTRYKLEKVASMSSTYAIRMYELLMQWSGYGWRWREVEVGWLRGTLMVSDDEYPRIFDFKKWVVDVALSQVNEHSDLTASYTQRKTGRNVTHLIFTFAPKEEAAPVLTAAQEEPAKVRESVLFQRLRGLGIGAKLAADWIKRDEARVLASADYVEAKAKAGQVKGSTAGYLRTVYESGADLGPSAFEAEQKAKDREAAKVKNQEEAEKRRQDQAKAKATEKAKESMSALSPEQRAVYAREWLDSGKAGRAVWDDKRGDFRETVDRIGFKLWLQNRLAA